MTVCQARSGDDAARGRHVVQILDEFCLLLFAPHSGGGCRSCGSGCSTGAAAAACIEQVEVVLVVVAVAAAATPAVAASTQTQATPERGKVVRGATASTTIDARQLVVVTRRCGDIGARVKVLNYGGRVVVRDCGGVGSGAAAA